ncbi:hypothetical protein EI555_010199 [Monodon monoceros]|uniref:Nucleoplasmin core domain-containing protein n=1 Tax=Monodon monoceros TaxID=40151 RepID=A0A4U1FCU8_MONMO|nr:hypothetical protein EI555_010199 [Monodon monoceros]
MEDSMDMDMSPLRPQNYLFSCELKANKDYHFKVDNDESEHQLSLRTLKHGSGPVNISGQHLVAMEEDAESEDEEEEDVKLLSISGKRSAPGSGRKFPQKKVKLAADEDDDEDDDDDDFDDKEAEEKSYSKEICTRYSSPKCAKTKPEWKRLQTINTKIERSRILQKNRKKLLKHQKDRAL